MSEKPDDLDFDRSERESAEADPDTNLILDYLANKLHPDDAGKLEERARRDKDFRYKLADLVLLKGLVMLALEKNPTATSKDCRRTQRMFLDYLKGDTSPAKTAELSRHLDECFECELAFERFQQSPGEPLAPAKRATGLRRWIQPGRSLVITALIAVVLAAGAIGMVGFLSSSAHAPAKPVANPARWGDAPLVAEAGLIQDPDEVRRVLAEVTADDPKSEASVRLSELVDQIIDAGDPIERQTHYETLARDFKAQAPSVLLAVAKNEPVLDARRTAFRVIGAGVCAHPNELLAATQREIDAHTNVAFLLLPHLAACGKPETVAFLRSAFADEKGGDEWWSQARFAIYCSSKTDPVIAARMRAALSDKNELMRSHAAIAAANEKDQAGLPVALGLLDSVNPSVRENAAIAIARLGLQPDVDRLFERAWAREPKLLKRIQLILTGRGMSPPTNF